MRWLLVRQIFHRDLALGKFFEQIRIMERGEAVTDALGAQIERAPNGFGRASLAGVGGQAQAVVGGPSVSVAEQFGRSFLLVAADADADDLAVMVAHGKLEDFLRGLGAELADGVEDPEQRDAEVAGAARASAVETFENGGEILLAPKADSNRNVNFGVQDVFFLQPLHQAVGDQFVVVGVRRCSVMFLKASRKPGKSA